MISESLPHLEFHADQMLPQGGRFLVVGDVHGEFDLLMNLLMIAGFREDKDWLIFLGDLIDRGPNSADVLRWVIGQKRAVSLLGNHEAMMLEAAQGISADRIWARNGGNWGQSLESDEREFLQAMVSTFPLSVRLNFPDGRRIGLVHAEVRPGATWCEVQATRYQTGDGLDDKCETLTSSLLWGRYRFRSYRFESNIRDDTVITPGRAETLEWAKAPVQGVDQVICGHSIMESRLPGSFGGHLMIDTGAYQQPDGRLTAIDAETGDVYQAVRFCSDGAG